MTQEKEFVENHEGVHLMHGEYTLCGDAFDIGQSEMEDDHDGHLMPTKRKTVTCPRCASVIELCRGTRIGPPPQTQEPIA